MAVKGGLALVWSGLGCFMDRLRASQVPHLHCWGVQLIPVNTIN